MNTEPKHQYEHEEPTVIHHPDEDMTVLARWLYHGMQQGARFWLLLGGGLAALIAALLLFNNISSGTSPAGQAWTELMSAKTPQEMTGIAETFPDTTATPWAKLQAASNYYLTAGFDLPDPAKRDTALPQLKKALDLFEEIAKSAPKGSAEGLVATMGLARTHEVRNELPEAIKAYEAVASGWPRSAEAKEAKKLAKRLTEPEAVAFYKAFYDYKTPAASLPGGLPSNHPSLNGPMIPAPALPGLPGMNGPTPGSSLFNPPSPTTPLDLPPPPTPPATPAKTEAPKAEMTKPAAPKAETPKVEAPKAEPKPAPKPAEAPKPAPKAEAPKPEMAKPAPKAEAPKTEPAKPAESPKPAPKPEAPKAEAPKPAPKPEAPKAEAPKAEAPKPAAPKAEEKAKAAPKGELPDDVFTKPK